VNWRAITRAALGNVRAGEITGGGSTITQQLVKNIVVGTEQTLNRKLREAVYAGQLEQRLSKDEILTEYLDSIYFGAGATGISAAAHTYFGKPVPELNLAESAMLAGLMLAILPGCHVFDVSHQPMVHNPFPQLSRVAVAQNSLAPQAGVVLLRNGQVLEGEVLKPLDEGEGWNGIFRRRSVLAEGLRHLPRQPAVDRPADRVAVAADVRPGGQHDPVPAAGALVRADHPVRLPRGGRPARLCPLHRDGPGGHGPLRTDVPA
jgi:hypothetical protein